MVFELLTGAFVALYPTPAATSAEEFDAIVYRYRLERDEADRNAREVARAAAAANDPSMTGWVAFCQPVNFTDRAGKARVSYADDSCYARQ